MPAKAGIQYPQALEGTRRVLPLMPVGPDTRRMIAPPGGYRTSVHDAVEAGMIPEGWHSLAACFALRTVVPAWGGAGGRSFSTKHARIARAACRNPLSGTLCLTDLAMKWPGIRHSIKG
jgi:hypothetical protein